MVSRDGEHKCIGIWAYDRRPINGAAFVPFGNRLLTMDDPHTRELVEYQKKVLDALKIKYGPTHGEVKWFQGEPVLVEVCISFPLFFFPSLSPSFLLPLVSSHVFYRPFSSFRPPLFVLPHPFFNRLLHSSLLSFLLCIRLSFLILLSGWSQMPWRRRPLDSCRG
jgi:hypothetical protein